MLRAQSTDGIPRLKSKGEDGLEVDGCNTHRLGGGGATERKRWVGSVEEYVAVRGGGEQDHDSSTR